MWPTSSEQFSHVMYIRTSWFMDTIDVKTLMKEFVLARDTRVAVFGHVDVG